MGIKLSVYQRYVDDIVVVMKMINPGWYYDLNERKLIYNPEHNYYDMEPDLRSLSVIRDIANSQDSDIQLTVNMPSLNPN